MIKTIVPIKGMHCRSCEILVGEELEKIPEVKNAQVNYKKGQATIYSKFPIETAKIEEAVRKAGYEVGVDDSKSWISLNVSDYKDLAISLVLLLALYLLANKLGLFNINTATGNPGSLLVVLLVGLTAGISTCMALVGGLVLGISARHAEKHPEATAFQKFRPHLFFNLGRVLSYFLLGGVIGLVGKAFQLSGATLGLMTIVVGIMMLILGAQLTEMFPRLSNGGLTLPSSISKLLGLKQHHEKEYSHINSMLIGALTFFLPCGFTQAMQLYAMSTGSFWSGALIMAIFALGTAPGLLGIGGLTSLLEGSLAKKFFKFTGLVVIALALFNISNGWNLTGWKIFSAKPAASTTTQTDPNVTFENGIQIVRMTQVSSGYKPNKFTIAKGFPVRWVIDSKDSGSCSSSIYMPKQNIRKFLSPGENVIEFTPNQLGELKFTCSMGMYSGKFIVVEGKNISFKANGSNTDINSNSTAKSSLKPPPTDQVQIIKTTYKSLEEDIIPNEFKVTAGKPVRFVVDVDVDGEGCMSTILIPGLANTPEFLEKNKTLTFDFTPSKGEYEITCAMGVPRGKIVAV